MHEIEGHNRGYFW